MTTGLEIDAATIQGKVPVTVLHLKAKLMQTPIYSCNRKRTKHMQTARAISYSTCQMSITSAVPGLKRFTSYSLSCVPMKTKNGSEKD